MAEIQRVNPGIAASIGVGVNPTRSNAGAVVSALQHEAAQAQQNISKLGKAAHNLISGATELAQTKFDVDMKKALHEQEEAKKANEKAQEEAEQARQKAQREEQARLREEAKIEKSQFDTDYKKTSVLFGSEYDKIWKERVGLKIGQPGYSTEEEVVQKTIEAFNFTTDLVVEEAFKGGGLINFRNQNKYRALLPSLIKESYLFSSAENAKAAFREWQKKDVAKRTTDALSMQIKAGVFREDIIRDLCSSELTEFGRYAPKEQIDALVSESAKQGGLNLLIAETDETLNNYTNNAFNVLKDYLMQGYSLDSAKQFVLESAQTYLPRALDSTFKSYPDLNVSKEEKTKAYQDALTRFSKMLNSIEEENNKHQMEDLVVALNNPAVNGYYPQTQLFENALNAESIYGKKDKSDNFISPVRNDADSERLYMHWVNDLAQLDLKDSRDRTIALKIMQESVVLTPNRLKELRGLFMEALNNTGNPQKISPVQLKSAITSVFSEYGISYVSGSKNNNPDVEYLADKCIHLIRNNPNQYHAIVSAAIKEWKIERSKLAEGEQLGSAICSSFAGVDTGLKELKMLEQLAESSPIAPSGNEQKNPHSSAPNKIKQLNKNKRITSFF